MLGGVPQESVLGHHCTSALLCLVTLRSPLVFFPSQSLHLSCWSLTVCCCSCRLRDLEGIGKSLKYYRDSYHPLDDWIQQIETTQRKIQENQPENSKTLALQLNQQKVPRQILVPWFCLHLVGHEPHLSLLCWKKSNYLNNHEEEQSTWEFHTPNLPAFIFISWKSFLKAQIINRVLG